MFTTALLLAPDFCLILLGALLHRRANFGHTFWRGLEQLVYFVLFPALLFQSTSTVRLELASVAPLLAAALTASVAGLVAGYLALPLFRPDALLFASGLQTAFRFNSYIGLAVAARIGGEPGIALMAVLIGVHVPFCNAASVTVLARHRNTGIWREMVRNPLILATLAGLLVNLAGLRLPESGTLILTRLGNASIALGLMAIGAGLRLERQVAERAMIGWFTAVKLLLVPGVAWLLGNALELPPLQRQIVVMFAALPTASSAYILAVRMGGNGPIVAFLVTLGTLVSLVTLPLWLALVR